MYLMVRLDLTELHPFLICTVQESHNFFTSVYDRLVVHSSVFIQSPQTISQLSTFHEHFFAVVLLVVRFNVGHVIVLNTTAAQLTNVRVGFDVDVDHVSDYLWHFASGFFASRVRARNHLLKMRNLLFHYKSVK